MRRWAVMILVGALVAACAPSAAIPSPTPSDGLTATPSATASPTVPRTSPPPTTPLPSIASTTPAPTPTVSPTSAPFYAQVVYVAGFPIQGSARVRPDAIDAAVSAFSLLLRGNAAIVNRLRDAHLYAVVLAASEKLTDLPEYARFRGDTLPDGRRYDELRAIGPVPCVAGEENLLHLPGDVFAGATILVHECAHAVYLRGLDAAQQGRWNAIYAQSIAAGLWRDTYAATDPTEYFAELTESYFGVNAPPERGVHNDVNGAARLAAYDPVAFAFLDAVYTPNGTP